MEKIVIITGASKGLGFGLAKEYHNNGYRVISIARSKVEKLYSFEQYQCDLSKTENIEDIIIEVFSHLDKNNTLNLTLINNAGNLGAVNTLENISKSAGTLYSIKKSSVAYMEYVRSNRLIKKAESGVINMRPTSKPNFCNWTQITLSWRILTLTLALNR